MKQFLLICLFLLIFVNKSYPADKDWSKPGLIVQFIPTTVFDYTPRYRLGLVYDAAGRMGYSIDFGYGNSTLNKWALRDYVWKKNYYFLEIRPEIRYYLTKNKYYGFYGAGEGFYIKMKSVFENGRYSSSNFSQSISYDRVHFDKQKYGFHLKFGFNFFCRPRINFDTYAGLGIGFRKIVYSNALNPIVEQEPILFEWVPQNYLFEGETTLLHLTMGFKLGWKIFCCP